VSGRRYFPARESETDEERVRRTKLEKLQRNKGKLTRANLKDMEKSHALCILDFLGGNMRQTSLMTGHTIAELQEWRKELEGDAYELKFLRYKVATNVEGVMVNYIQSLAILALEKARTAKLKDVNTCITIAAKQVGNLKTKNERRTVKQRKKNELKPHKHPEELVKPPEPEPEPVPVIVEPEPAPPEPTERHKYESIVSQVIAESYAKDEPLTRDEAVNAVIMQRPEAKQYLLPDSVEALDTSDEGYSN